MQYENILPYVGSYLTYEEFTKNRPEIDISKNEWYRLNKGQTYQKTKSELKELTTTNFKSIGISKGISHFNFEECQRVKSIF